MKVVYTQANGTLAVIIPANKFVAEIQAAAQKLGEPLTDAQLAVMACGKALAQASDGTDPLICDEADIPTDRTFRNAWKRAGTTPVVVDMPTALEIAKNNIRVERAPLLAVQDVAFTKAQGAKNRAAADAAEAKRQALRDATADSRLTAAADPSSLKTAMEAVIADMKK
ncbi:MAG: hypothetical protein KIT32_12270 [Rhodocyclaceae bacterium]|nr:hypothetical protein [Rhodocyclaceae bacterium]